MGMSELAKQHMRERFENVAVLTRIPEARSKALRRVDEILDYYLDCRDNATEWDADRWGL